LKRIKKRRKQPKRKRANGALSLPRALPLSLQPYWLASFYKCSPVDFLNLPPVKIKQHMRYTRRLLRVMRVGE
jgi:hypothetical protein